MTTTNRDRISNRSLQKLAEAENLTQRAAWTKWRWGGHVVRQQQDRWAQSTPMWDPYIGDRSRGRPRKRWADFFKQVGRQQQDRWAQSTTMWDPYIGDRSRGRPRKRWADFFKHHAGVHCPALQAIEKSGGT